MIDPIIVENYYQPLEQEEHNVLKYKLELYIFIIICIILFAGLAVLLIITIEELLDQFIAGVGGLLAFGTCIYYIAKKSKDYRQDIRNGYKIVYTGKIEGKREDSSGENTTYHFTILRTEFTLSLEDWNDIQTDQMVEIHFAPKSKRIFKIVVQH
ncbi:hypothetical protein [Xanthocytophaga agilis]|uniref:Uncharacterized protein n=1 Tax=Xanthocytophaga agilis TaxID=3048010 RepID=A0AAE3R8Z9_9BACT|nr:hypothetical protein [Xanthocytophaga agilis]MDJ1503664.1 hypothetical protein [Xanthocytophaga agilis]